MKHLFIAVLILVGSGNIFSQYDDTYNSQSPRSALPSALFPDGDPFARHLNVYQSWRDGGSNTMFWSIVSIASFSLTSTYFKTAESLDFGNPSVNQVGSMSSNFGIGLAGVGALIGFLMWHDNSNKYMEMLRLQSQYYNLIRTP